MAHSAPDRLPPPRSVQLAERDRRLLAFTAEHRFVLAGHIAQLLGLGTPAAARRLRALAGAGYLRGDGRFRFDPTAFQVTRAGLDAAACDLPLPRPINPANYRHEVGVGWLMVAARRGVFGELRAIVSERRMRSQDGREPDLRAHHGVRIGDGGRERLHYPDMTIITAGGHRVDFELELSTKDPRRRERILTAYATDRRVDAVVYLVRTPAAGRAIEDTALRVGIADRVHVQRFEWHQGRAPGDPHPVAARRAGRRTGVRGAGASGAGASGAASGAGGRSAGER